VVVAVAEIAVVEAAVAEIAAVEAAAAEIAAVEAAAAAAEVAVVTGAAVGGPKLRPRRSARGESSGELQADVGTEGAMGIGTDEGIVRPVDELGT
jgi:hypothetical protein